MDTRVYDVVLKAIQIVRGLGFKTGSIESLQVSNRLSRTWAYCSKDKRGYHTIVFGYDVVHKASKEGLLKVAIHEVIHTIDGCWDHNKKFLSIGKMVQKKYGLPITQFYESEELGIVSRKR